MSKVDEILNIDLNDVVSKAVSKQIKAFEKTIEQQEKKIADQSIELKSLKAKAKLTDTANGLIEKLRERYAAITDTKDNQGNMLRTEAQGKYSFIREVAKLVHGIVLDEELRSKSYTHSALAYAARNHKQEVSDILRLIDTDQWVIPKLQEIHKFRMPSEFSKGEIMQVIRQMPYGYNGCSFGTITHWVESSFTNYVPMDLLMESPHFVADDCFQMVLTSIKEDRPNSGDLFALPFYNYAITDDQIKALGALAADMSVKGRQQETHHGKFILKYMEKFNKEDIEKLFVKMNIGTCDWEPLYWGIFPLEYQRKAFRKMTFKRLSELLSSYGSKFGTDQKEAIYADWFLHNPHSHTPKSLQV